METYNLSGMKKKVKKSLDKMRFAHTEGVMYTSAALAMCYEENLERAMTAGLLHDCAKCIPNAEKLELCRQYGISLSEAEQKNPHLLHAKLGARIAEEKYGVKDPEILSAISCHTTGKPGMTRLEKILFLADYIEPGRERAPHLAEIRKTAFQNLDRAVFLTLKDTLNYLKSEKACLDPHTEEAYNYYRRLNKKKEEK